MEFVKWNWLKRMNMHKRRGYTLLDEIYAKISNKANVVFPKFNKSNVVFPNFGLDDVLNYILRVALIITFTQ
jgi:hypothetical protein